VTIWRVLFIITKSVCRIASSNRNKAYLYSCPLITTYNAKHARKLVRNFTSPIVQCFVSHLGFHDAPTRLRGRSEHVLDVVPICSIVILYVLDVTDSEWNAPIKSFSLAFVNQRPFSWAWSSCLKSFTCNFVRVLPLKSRVWPDVGLENAGVRNPLGPLATELQRVNYSPVG
jgi:hypothetical protein